MSETFNKVFEYKLRTNKKFIAAVDFTLWKCRELYNACLEQRISHYLYTGKSPNWIEQCRELTALRETDENHGSLSRGIQTEVIKRLERSYQAFFRRVQGGEKAGFPRFQGRERYNSFEYAVDQRQPCPLQGDKLTIPKIGSCRVRLSRKLAGPVKQVRILRRVDGYYVQLTCAVSRPLPLAPTGERIGLDVGLATFATLSNGEKIENPRFLRQAEAQLSEAQRVLSGRKLRSKRRGKAKAVLAKRHQKVARCRKHFQYQTANALVKRFDLIAVEKLKVKNMLGNECLAKSISDVAWSGFFQVLDYKAECAGRQVVKVDPSYTSQTCSVCGQRQKLTLAERIFECANVDRDVNAARNILSRGQVVEVVKTTEAKMPSRKRAPSRRDEASRVCGRQL